MNVVKGLWINGQAEFNTNHLDLGSMGALDIKAIKDYGVGANYRFSPKLVLKAEWHDFTGYQVGVPINPFGPAVGDKYFILGVAAAF